MSEISNSPAVAIYNTEYNNDGSDAKPPHPALFQDKSKLFCIDATTRDISIWIRAFI